MNNKEILDNAPEGSVGINRHNNYTYHAKDMRSLADIRTIIEQAERIAELEEGMSIFATSTKKSLKNDIKMLRQSLRNKDYEIERLEILVKHLKKVNKKR